MKRGPGQRGRVYRQVGKPLLDRIAGVTLMAAFAPLMAVIAVAALWFQGRPILFRQTRPGLNGRPFELLKFRTMRDARTAAGALLSDGERLTPFGRWLRRTSLDELPQLFNVLRGDLSLVGPRPLLPEYLPLYSAQQRRRHDVRPGITGLAQVSGRNRLDWPTRLRLDVEYVERHDLRLDAWILGKTLVNVMTRQGIDDGRSETCEPFLGQQ